MAVDKVRALDACWLHFETQDMPLHVASALVFKLPEGKADTFFDELKGHVQSRIHLLKTYSVKKKDTPLNLDHPVWVEADEIDIEYHVRRLILPEPGTQTQFDEACGHIQEMPLDPERPLWQLTLIEGLKNGRVALFVKNHHSVIDGESGVAQLDVLFDKTPVPREVQPPTVKRHSNSPSSLELLADAYVRFWMQPVELMTKIPDFAKAAQNFARVVLDTNRVSKVLTPAPKTRFNRSISRRRVFSSVSIPLSEIKDLKKAAGVTVNDAVLGVCSGALRRFLMRTGELPKHSLVAAVPVSLRRGDASSADEMGTLVTSMTCPLATNEHDATKRMALIKRGTEEAKRNVEATKGALIQNFNVFGAPIALRLAAQAYGALRLADHHSPIANLVVSNVAGPRHAIYLMGAEMEHYYPVSGVAHGQGINITVQSYRDTLNFGLIGCTDLVPDLTVLRDCIVASLQELKSIYLESEELDEEELDVVLPSARDIEDGEQYTDQDVPLVAAPLE